MALFKASLTVIVFVDENLNADAAAEGLTKEVGARRATFLANDVGSLENMLNKIIAKVKELTKLRSIINEQTQELL